MIIINDALTELNSLKMKRRASQNSSNENGALPIQHVGPMLRNIHNMLEVDFDEQTNENKELMSDIVEMCQAIADDYWMYKRK